MEVCKLEHIRKDYRMGEVVTPLKDVSLVVEEGEFISVEGPSGIGKSTLLYVMGILLQSDSGSYMFRGQDVARLNDRARSELRARQIGFLFQDSSMIQALTLRENLAFTQRVGGRQDRAQVDRLLEQFGLYDRADFLPHQLSGGQRRRAMAARALIHAPALILADEPTNDLDEHWSREIIRILREQTGRGAAVVMVTHNTRWADTVDRRCCLDNGVLADIEENNTDLF